jgi:carboxyl-terminal processing protease
MTNKGAASASELFAAAMQDYGRAVIAGDSRTFGKGTLQTLLEPAVQDVSSSAGALMLTVKKLYRVTGLSTQLKGVISDVVIPSLTDRLAFGEAGLPHALPYDEVKPVPLDRRVNQRRRLLDELRRRSARRIRLNPVFDDLAQEAGRLDQRWTANRLSLNERLRRDQLAQGAQRRRREEAHRKTASAKPWGQAYQLTLADVDRSKLKRITQKAAGASKPAASTGSQDLKSPVADARGIEGSETSIGTDWAAREVLEVLSDLVDLTKFDPLSSRADGRTNRVDGESCVTSTRCWSGPTKRLDRVMN